MSSKLNIVADAHIWGVESAFSELGGFNARLTMLENHDITRQALLDADILLTRSSTKVNAELLQGTPVKFAATATIGDDHYDKQWLDDNGIIWANAAGSSTGSVIEYMITALLHLHVSGLISIPESCIGIIGVGRIGSALAEVCKAIGMKVLLNDPPRARSEGNEGFSTLDELLEQADIISLHTPMIREGEDVTAHLLSAQQLSRFKGIGIFNAARGGCVDNAALLKWLDGDTSRFAALDCWEFEPTPMIELLQHPQMAIATPHIAGHSLDGKAANTLYIHRALCRFLELDAVWDMQARLPSPPPPLHIDYADNLWLSLYRAACALYPVMDDHDSMKGWVECTPTELPRAFTGYRRHYPVRRSWQHARVHFDATDATLLQLADAFGIKIV